MELRRAAFRTLRCRCNRTVKAFGLVTRHQSTIERNADFKVAVVGSGPAGFYTSYHLLEKLPESSVDMYESLPVPFGLSRFGVAPDHPEVKFCQEKFSEVAESPRFRFVGNTTIGQDVDLKALKENYNSIIFAYGSSEDRKLDIPGENLPGVYSAREFVGWYNGVPSLQGLDPALEDAEDVVIIGNGNVALDVARILLSSVDRFKTTDISDHAFEKLKKSRVKNVNIVARRGLLQSAFTTKEVRELINEEGVGFHPLEESYISPYKPFLPLMGRTIKRVVSVLEKASNNPKPDSSKQWKLHYLMSPIEIFPNAVNEKILSSTKFEINTLIQDDIKHPAISKGSGKYISLKNELLFRSIGYKSLALKGMSDLGIKFDSIRGLVPNNLGRVILTNDQDKAEASPGLYATGWVKNGPTGVIAETMRDSFEVAETIMEDYYNNKVDKSLKPGYGAIGTQNKSSLPVFWHDWLKIDSYEKEKGKELGKPRVKLSTTEEMLNVLSSS